jgi:peptidoglycan/xylan/chitin deacetylase (PgdA/CDA1 family)
MCFILIFYIKVMEGYQSNEAQINIDVMENSQKTSRTEIIYKSGPNMNGDDIHITDTLKEHEHALNSMSSGIVSNTQLVSLVQEKHVQDNKAEVKANNIDLSSSISEPELETNKNENIAYTKNITRQIDPQKPMIALTFDDGPHYEYTNNILDALEKYNGVATFFVLGSRAEKNKDIIKRITEGGNQIGNHTYDHKQLTKLSGKEITDELTKTSDIIQDITSIRPSLLRPTYGNVNDNVRLYADAPLILWSIDTLDWKSRNKKKIVNAALKKVRSGDIILMHDIYKSTAMAAEVIIKELSSRGYQLVTVEELYEAKGVGLLKGKAYAHAY